MLNYRRLPPIKTRSWTLKLYGIVIVWAALLFQTISSLDLSPSFRASNQAAYYILWELSVATLLPCFIRHSFLLKIAKLQTQLVKDPKDSGVSELLKKYKYYSSERFTWINFIWVASVPVTVTLVFFAIWNPADGAKFQSLCNFVLFNQVIITSIYCVYYLYGQEPDNYGIMAQYITSVCIIAWYAVCMGFSYLLRIEVLATIASVLAPVCVILVDLVWPVIVCRTITKNNLKADFMAMKRFTNQTLTFNTELTELSTVAEANISIPKRTHSSNYDPIDLDANNRKSADDFLDRIISSYKLSEKFGDFLAKEYSVQNLLFVERVSSWKSATDPDIKSNMLTSIIENFLANDAVNQISIPGSIAVMLDIDPEECVEQADVHIRNIIHENHLNRFCVSL